MSETSQPSPGPTTGAPARKPMAAPGVWSRLRIYLIGIGIGLVLLGSFHVMKQLAEKQEQAAAKAANNATSKTGGQPPNPPQNP